MSLSGCILSVSLSVYNIEMYKKGAAKKGAVSLVMLPSLQDLSEKDKGKEEVKKQSMFLIVII